MTCDKHQFQCQSGECISSNFVNDGNVNCADGSDEVVGEYLFEIRLPQINVIDDTYFLFSHFVSLNSFCSDL